ncbi:MAG: hypothetical protein H7Z37_18715 [Pyrinomonadaceae bacterium]|nr:hypothetical protein [Pyrinomonadaceae bacterium]
MFRSFNLLSLICLGCLILGFTPVKSNAQKSKSAKSPIQKAGKTSGKADSKKEKQIGKTSDAGKSAKSVRENQTTAKKSDKNAAGKSSQTSSSRTASKTESKKQNEKSVKDDKSSKNSKQNTLASRKAAAEEARQREAERQRVAQAEAEERRRRAEAAQAEAARRQAALEAKRRREQAIREAQARARAFENGLRTETVANIAADDTTGEDLEVRRATINALGNHAGTVVVMDAQTGRVLTAVNQDWAYRKGFKPCSTVKLVTGIAGKQEGVIGESGNLKVGYYPMELTDALAYSNNKFFQNVGGTVGYTKMMKYARELGFGAKTGVNIPNESAGKIPDFKSGYAVNHMSSHGDDFEVTPLQLANIASAIGNGGNLLTPQIVRTNQDLKDLKPQVRRKFEFNQNVLPSMETGMIGAVNYGTAKLAFDSSLNIGGKTGSCIGQGSWLGLFASVAPISNPRLAVAVVLRGQRERGKYAAGVAGKVYRSLAVRLKTNSPAWTANINQPNVVPQNKIAIPRPKIDEKTAARLGNEDADDEERDELQPAQGDVLPRNDKPRRAPIVVDDSYQKSPAVVKTNGVQNNATQNTTNQAVKNQNDSQVKSGQNRPRIVVLNKDKNGDIDN